MSRQINQPVASVKLTNVATVRLTVKGQRFEVACYKNKVLDYRAGLETDLSEVLQTTNVFTSVAKGQFAAASDLARAFGERVTMEEICVQILTKGKSLQVSEGERHQLYESCLTQIATMIATNCIHPGTGKPYTVTQIKHALTKSIPQPTTTTMTQQQPQPDTTATKTKKKASKKQQQQQQQQQRHLQSQPTVLSSSSSFVLQPHKSIKQQYLQALKYLSQCGLPIQRACMELQWRYTADQQDQVTAALQQLGEIHPHATTTSSTSSTSDAADTTTTTTTTTTTPTTDTDPTNALEDKDSSSSAAAAAAVANCSCTFFVDPSVYRPLQELALSTVPGSRLEIVRQQVFQAIATTTPTPTTAQNVVAQGDTDASTTTAQTTTAMEMLGMDQKSTKEEEEEVKRTTAVVGNQSEEDGNVGKEPNENSDSSSSDDDDDFMTMQKAKAKRKQQKKAQRRQEKHQAFPEDSSTSSLPNDEPKEDWVVLSKDEEKDLNRANHPRVANGIDPTHAAATAAAESLTTSLANEGNNENDVRPYFSCNTCVGSANAFRTQSEYRAHFRSDWHRFNQKLKSQGAAASSAVSLHEFEQCDAETFFVCENGSLT